MQTTSYSDEQYSGDFLGDQDLKKRALDRAIDIRKFEIDLYWKRTTYFWTFIAATLAGFFAIQASSASNKGDMSFLLANLGIVFSVGWFCVNRGSKFWQENWEFEVAPPLQTWVLVGAAYPDIVDAVTVHPACQEELYDPGRDVSINPNENSILTP